MTPATLTRPEAQGLRREAPAGSSRRELETAVDTVRESASRFARLSLDERVALARSMQLGYLQIAEDSVRAACLAKGIPLGTPLEGEEWALGPFVVVRHLRLIQQSLLALKHTGNTPTGELSRTPDGRLAVQVFPTGAIDGLLFNGVRVDVHLQAGVTEAGFHESRAQFYKAPDHQGRVALILGAGNINAIPSMDAITKLFNEGKTCVIKMNPVNAYVGPYLEIAFARAIAEGFLAIVYGGSEEGEYLVNHPGIDEVHITGSDKSYDRIVWGPPGPERNARKAHDRPLVNKPVTAELGNVSPVIVVPGPYTASELAYQAQDIGAAVACNASFNCNAATMVVTPRGWKGRDDLLAALERTLAATPVRKAYYPGAKDRWQALAGWRQTRKLLGTADPDSLPWTILPDLDPTDRNEPAFNTEPFCSIISETQVASDDPVEFLEEAVNFANDRLWGTLSAGMVVHPKLMKDPRVAQAVEQAIVRLRYGVVAVNAWSGYVFAYAAPPWGAHPSSSRDNIQSGCDWVHNTPMIEGIEKAVLRHPVTMTPKPSYFHTHRTADTLMRRMTGLEEQASWGRVPGVLAAAMRA